MMEWPKPTVFDARNTSPWLTREPQVFIKPDFADNEELKKAYGVALGQGLDAFNAAMEIFNQDMPKSLWASINWIKDTIVIAEKDTYLKALKRAQKPLDKEELLAEVLDAAKIAPEFKDKASLLKLYSEIAGYTGKIAIDASTNNVTNNQNNVAQIVLVRGTEAPPLKTIDNSSDINTKSKISNNNGLPNLKLVGSSR